MSYTFKQVRATFLAHLYCVIYPSWHVCCGGNAPDNPEWIAAASGDKSGGDFNIEVLTYPKWMVRRTAVKN